jgi:four helix bundle protein
MGSRSYRDLVVWQKGIELSVLVYEVCSTFPKSELYGLADQMKRAVVSISSNIAEGQARQHIGEFRQFLSISNGSLAELDTQRIIAERMGFISPQGSVELDRRITEIRKMLYSLRSKLKTEN